MKIKKLIAITIIICLLIASTFSTYSNTSLDLDKLQKNLQTILNNKDEDVNAIFSITNDLIKFAVGKFKDVKSSDWFAEAVGKLNVLKIIDGYKGNFNPYGKVTRAEFVKMLVQANKLTLVDGLSFKDLKPTPTSKPHWSTVYVETALKNGIIVKSEIGDNFYPDAPLTRTDMALMICRALKLQPFTGNNPFVDVTPANGYITKLFEEYIIRGSVENGVRMYKPEGLTIRAEAAAILSRMIDYKANPAGFKKKMADAEKPTVSENGVPLRLYEYTDGTTTKDAKGTYHWTFRERDKEYYDRLAVTSPARPMEVDKFPSVEAFVQYQVDIVKRYMKYNWNVDYRTVGQDYIKGIDDTLGVNSEYHANKNIEDFKKYKVICQSEFLTDYDLIYQRDGFIDCLRGTLRIKFDKSTNLDFIKKTLKITEKKIEPGKWYDIDLEVQLDRASVSKTWNVYKNNFYYILGVVE